MKSALVLILATVSACMCTVSDDTLRHTVEAYGFTDVEPGSYAFMSCGKDDSFRSHFTAKNPQGTIVHGVVCCGWLKSCTVRID